MQVNNPFIIANSFSIAENACLKDMESIYLVVHDTERGFRLSQACDVSNIFPNSWDEQTQENITKQRKPTKEDLGRFWGITRKTDVHPTR